MKISNDERREVAPRLRDMRASMETEHCPGDPLEASTVYLLRIGRAIKVDRSGRIMERLADLIEPGETDEG